MKEMRVGEAMGRKYLGYKVDVLYLKLLLDMQVVVRKESGLEMRTEELELSRWF